MPKRQSRSYESMGMASGAKRPVANMMSRKFKDAHNDKPTAPLSFVSLDKSQMVFCCGSFKRSSIAFCNGSTHSNCLTSSILTTVGSNTPASPILCNKYRLVIRSPSAFLATIRKPQSANNFDQ
uniref:Uncharacterized protein n=1 Tax=Romanomermis culicivorax TaxID=13658 RepID=A0A915HP20_ROMCU